MQGSDKGILEEALKILEEKITIDCEPGDGPVMISKDNTALSADRHDPPHKRFLLL